MRNIVDALLIRGPMILLARRSPHRQAYPGLWSFPGGHVEDGESLTDALDRELREEVGVIPTGHRFLRSIADPNRAGLEPVTYHMYAATEWQGEPAILDQEAQRASLVRSSRRDFDSGPCLGRLSPSAPGPQLMS